MKRSLDELEGEQSEEYKLENEIFEARSRVRILQDEQVPAIDKSTPSSTTVVASKSFAVPAPKPAAPTRTPLSSHSRPFNAEPSPKSTVALRKDFYINMLEHYQKAKPRDCMVRFRELFFLKMHTEGMDEPRSIKNVMMTCFGFEQMLLTSVIQHSKKLLIYNDSPDSQFSVTENFQGNPNFTVVLPAKASSGWGSGAFHPKLWFIEFEGGVLRVVVGSGNLSIGDWAVWSNCLWYQDFQKKIVRVGSADEPIIEPDTKLGGKSGDFYPYLNNFVDKLTVSGLLHTKRFSNIHLDQYDFDTPIFPVLVASVPGKYQINPSPAGSFSYGIERLREIMIAYKRNKTLPHLDARITYQSSSIGSVTTSFLIKFLSKLRLTKAACCQTRSVS